MDTGATTDVVRLDVPADVRFLRLLRVSVATSLLEHEPTLEHLDDVRLAVDELAVSVIQAAPEGERLRVLIEPSAAGVVVRGRVAADGEPPVVSEVGELLLGATCRQYRLEREGPDLVFELQVGGD